MPRCSVQELAGTALGTRQGWRHHASCWGGPWTRTALGCSCQDASEGEQPGYHPASAPPCHALLDHSPGAVGPAYPWSSWAEASQRRCQIRTVSRGSPLPLPSPPSGGKPKLSSKFLLAWLPPRSGNSTLINVSANPSSAGGASNSFTVPRVQKDPRASPLAP